MEADLDQGFNNDGLELIDGRFFLFWHTRDEVVGDLFGEKAYVDDCLMQES